jgi:hypothetical protein
VSSHCLLRVRPFTWLSSLPLSCWYRGHLFSAPSSARSGTISHEHYATIKAVGYRDQPLVEISLAVALIFTNTFNRINDTDVDFPPVS